MSDRYVTSDIAGEQRPKPVSGIGISQRAEDEQRCTRCHAVLTEEARCSTCGLHQ